MAAYRPRGLSPSSSRRYGDARFSTPTVFASSFDTGYSSHQPRASVDSLPKARPIAERLYDAQPIAKVTYPDSGHSGTISRTEYAVRPRHNSTTANEGRKISGLLLPSSSTTHTRPLVNNSSRERERPRSPLQVSRYSQGDSDRLIYPAITSPRQSYQRHSSANASDLEPLGSLDRDRRERGGYRGSGTNGQKVYAASGPLVRYQEEDGYSYTGPREQFNRDYPGQIPPRHTGYTRRDRADIPPDVKDFPEKRSNPQPRRDLGPPPQTTRQFDRLGNSDSRRHGGKPGTGSDVERDSIAPRRRHSVRGPVALHQEREEGYISQRDDPSGRRNSRTRRHRHEEEQEYASDFEDRHKSSHHERRRTRNSSTDRADTGKALAAAGLGGVAAAGLASGALKDSRGKEHESDREARRERRRERRRRERDLEDIDGEYRDDQGRVVDRPRDRTPEITEQTDLRDGHQGRPKKDRSGSDSMEEENDGRRRHHRRRKHRSKEETSKPGDSESDTDDRPLASISRDDPRASGRDAYEHDEADPRKSERSRHAERETGLPQEETYEEFPPPELEDTRPRRVQLVEPSQDKEPEPKPKGILKPARQVPFPEDPNPTREGVAPLKEAGKKGIPPDARWTKINRMLVNPAALEASHERFEEREDYVIVLRVLSKEDIQKLADKTMEIRLAREKEWQERERRRAENRHFDSDDSSEDERRAPLAIEAPPAHADPRFLPPQGFNNNNNPYVPVPAMAGMNLRAE